MPPERSGDRRASGPAALSSDHPPAPSTETPPNGADTPVAWAVALALFGGTLAAYLVGAGRSYGYDESVTVGAFVKVPALLDPFRRQIVFNNHPLFSFLEHLVWSAGGTTEAWLRVLPASFGAGTVGLSAWWLARRLGVRAAVFGGVLVAANPHFAELSRQVRGYSMLAFCAAVTTLLTLRLPAGDDRRWPGVTYVLCSAAGLAVHFYMGIVIAAQIAYVAARGEVSREWRVRWYASLTLGALAYLGIADEMGAAARERGRVFHAAFPLDAARAVLGTTPVAVAVVAALVGAVAYVAGRRRTVVLPAAVVTLLLLIVWVVMQPFDLYTRFLVWLVPGVGACVALAVRRWPLAVAPALIAVAAMVWSEAPEWRADDRSLPLATSIAAAATARGDTPCAIGSEALLGYTADLPREVARGSVDDCDLVLSILSGNLLGARAAAFPHVEPLGDSGMLVYRR